MHQTCELQTRQPPERAPIHALASPTHRILRGTASDARLRSQAAGRPRRRSGIGQAQAGPARGG